MPYKLRPEKPIESESESSLIADIGRVPLQAIEGGRAALTGWAGNTFKVINDLIAGPATKALTGQDIPYEETFVGKLLPTTETNIKESEKNLPYLKPKNRVEKLARDVTADTVEIFSPGQAFKMGKYAFSPLRSLGISLVGNTAGEAAYQWTGDQTKADKVKSATMLMASLFNPKTAEQAASDLYKKAAASKPSGVNVATNNLNSNLTNLENKILVGRNYNQLAPSEKFVIDEINKIKQSTSSGSVDIDTLLATKRSLNETLSQFVFDVRDPKAKNRAKDLAKNIINYIKEPLEDYGKINPKWWQTQQAADQAHGAIAKSNFVSRLLEKFMKGKPSALAHLFGIGIPAAVGTVSKLSGGTIALGYQAAKIGTRMAKSPELRKHYVKVVSAALGMNPKIIQKEIDEMDKAVKKENKIKYRLRP